MPQQKADKRAPARAVAAPAASTPRVLAAVVPADCAGRRLDRVLGQVFPDYSRTRMQRWVREGRVQVDGAVCVDIRACVDGGERLCLEPAAAPATPGWEAQPLAHELDLVYRDPHLLVVNKPAGLVVHPGAGNPDRTLVNALLHLDARLAALPRAGLVHRLDKNTTGLMVVACTLEAQTRLSRLIADRRVRRGYEAVVHGIAPVSGTVDAALGRHRVHRTRMSVRRDGGRHAVTHFRRLAGFRAHSHLAVQLETGRTHQIRVHMTHIGHPIVGDREYGGVRPAPVDLPRSTAALLDAFPRQALHARSLAFDHPLSGEAIAFEAPLPADIAALLDALAGAA